jgi:hypothetical protein
MLFFAMLAKYVREGASSVYRKVKLLFIRPAESEPQTVSVHGPCAEATVDILILTLPN